DQQAETQPRVSQHAGQPMQQSRHTTRPTVGSDLLQADDKRSEAKNGREVAVVAMGFWRRAQEDPSWIAVVDPDGTEHTAGDLLGRANQLTHALHARGLQPGDGIASLLPNGAAPVELYLAALQAGWYLTPINWHFTAPEAAYIAADCGAK